MAKNKKCEPCEESKKKAIASKETQPTTNEVKAGSTSNGVIGGKNNKKKTPGRTPIKHF